MNVTTLKERLEKANTKIEKKQNTITKKLAQIAKKSAYLATKYGIDSETFDKYHRERFDHDASNDIYWTMCDIDTLKDDIKRGKREIEETKKTVEKYEKQLAGELERESTYTREIPESMKQMQAQLVEKWDAWDIQKRDRLRELYKTTSFHEFMQKHTYADYEFKSLTDAEIHESNMRDAKALVLNLYNRVKDITGEVTNWAHISLEQGACGMPVLNGFVQGKEGRAYVESITAGGWNIQRFHIRVLVHDCK